MVTMATQMPHVVAPLRNEIVSHFAKVVYLADDNSQESKDLVVCMYVVGSVPPVSVLWSFHCKQTLNYNFFILTVYLTIIIPRVGVGYELAIIISYPTSVNEIIVLLKMPTKYREFFPTLFVKTTDFHLVFNFEQMRTVTVFGEHGIMAHIP